MSENSSSVCLELVDYTCTFWRKSKLENWRRSRPRVSFYMYFCSWPCECDVNPRCASCIKVKMATESGLTTQALLLERFDWPESNGGAVRNYLSSWGENVGWRLAVVPARRICRDEEEHSSRGFWIFRRSALWIELEPLRCLSKLAIADRRYSRVVSSSTSTSVQAFSSRRICSRRNILLEGSGSSDALLFG